MTLTSVETVFINELRDVYDAEKRLTRAIPKLAKAATSAELRQALEEHLTVTKKQVSRLEDVFKRLGLKAQSKPCEGMKGLIQEGEEAVEQDGEVGPCDLALVGAARRVEHYEMAAYQSLLGLIPGLERDGENIANLLQETLDEEEEADRMLAELAATIVRGQRSESDEEESQTSASSRR
jgi:ferritin-like metal-binding protein YciE